MKFAITSLLAAAALAPTLANATSFSMAIVADNDFAVFTGTGTGINHLLYQNNASWMDQIPSLKTLQFDMPEGDTKFYLLGMGGGSEENISGTVNGKDIATLSVQMSSHLVFGGYTLAAASAGTFDAKLSDMQANFPNLSWAPAVANTTQYVIKNASPNGSGYTWDRESVHLFSFDASAVGVSAASAVPAIPAVTAVPEPSTYALTLLGLAGIGAVTRKRRASV